MPMTNSFDTGTVATRKSKSTGSVLTVKKIVSNTVRMTMKMVLALMLFLFILFQGFGLKAVIERKL